MCTVNKKYQCYRKNNLKTKVINTVNKKVEKNGNERSQL